jgi:hypothetical protein
MIVQMETVPLSRRSRTALRVFLLAQIAHTMFIPLVDTLFHLIWPFPISRGGLLVTLPWWERLHWDYIFVGFIALVFEIILWRRLSKPGRHAWTYLAVTIAVASLYLLWVIGTGFHLVPLQIQDMWLLAAIPVGVFGLWESKGTVPVKRVHLAEITFALLSAAVIVYVEGRYFSHGSIQWSIDVPAYVDIICHSGFSYPQENSLILCVLCYSLYSSIHYLCRKIR